MYILFEILWRSSMGFMSVPTEHEDGLFPNSCTFSNSIVDHEKFFRWNALKHDVHSHHLKILVDSRFWLGWTGVGLRFCVSNESSHDAHTAGLWGHFELHPKAFGRHVFIEGQCRRHCIYVYIPHLRIFMPMTFSFSEQLLIHFEFLKSSSHPFVCKREWTFRVVKVELRKSPPPPNLNSMPLVCW